ncbi:MAG: serine/threonine-protein kinase [Myxococcota bacterium]
MPNANPVDASSTSPVPTDDFAASIEAWAETLLGRTIDRRYRIDSVLGCGAVGVVFKGMHLRLNKAVAIKVLQQDARIGATFRARFEREALSASRLSHPNCVEILDYGDDDGLVYFVMPFVEGVELSDLLGDEMTTARALTLFDQVLAGLEHAHEQGLIHRDIKPENILVVRDHAGREQVKLIDFGIAKVEAPADGKHLTSMGDVFGTPQYMSPEQCRGDVVTERTDLYSAGLVLHELLTGQITFDAPESFEVLRLQLLAPPPPLPPQLQASIGPLLEGLLAKEPAERFSDVAEVREALAAVREGRPICRPTPRGKTEPSALTALTSSSSGMGAMASASVISGSHPAMRVPDPEHGRGPRGTEVLVDSVELTPMQWAPMLDRRSPAPRPPSRRPLIAAVLVAVTVIVGLLVYGVVRQRSVVSDIAQLLVTAEQDVEVRVAGVVAGIVAPE